MFREMRRKNQALSREECGEILHTNTHGVLALAGGEYPYAVPLSYVYDGDKIYFHCAKAGHKLDAIRADAKASFCVVGQDEIVGERFTTYYRSVIVFGKVRILEDEGEKLRAIRALAKKYSPGETEESREKEISGSWPALCMLELSIEHMTGKEAIELKGAK